MEIKSATQMATVYGLKSPQAFNKLLAKCGLLQHTEKGYTLAEALRGRGYVTAVESPYYLPNGLRVSKKKPMWTVDGQEYVRKTLLHHGISPIDEQQSLFNN